MELLLLIRHNNIHCHREMTKSPGIGQRSKKYKKPLFGTGQRKFKKRHATKIKKCKSSEVTKRNERKPNKSNSSKRKRIYRNIRNRRT